MKWSIQSGSSGQAPGSSKEKIIKILLENRGLKSKNQVSDFLNLSDPRNLKLETLGLNTIKLRKAIGRIKLAVKNKEPIVVYGDYDADGICATAILWEAINSLGGRVMPFIPLREKEGYGLSVEGIDTILGDEKYKINKISNDNKGNKGSNQANGLIITVDSGIVAHQAVEYAKKKGLDVIVIDHHEKPKKLPNAFAIIHTEKLCASGIAYFFAKSLVPRTYNLEPALELAAIATVTDLMPLIGPNRSIVKFGLAQLNNTSRLGLRSLLDVAGIKSVGTYEIGYMIGPRLNASGRIDNALSALRLLCTKNKLQADELACHLNTKNIDRQKMVEDQTVHAMQLALVEHRAENRIIVLSHESYHQGVIGLIAGKLVERYYLPAIVIAKADGISKASARSISGFNIIEAIRSTEDILVNAGGHPMAAGFTIETDKISNFKFQISNFARKKITSDILEKKLRIDCELDLSILDLGLYLRLQTFAPYGIGNPEPTFASFGKIESFRTVGADGKHLKLVVSGLDAIAFNQGSWSSKLKVGEEIKLVYTLDLNSYNGRETLQLKVRDLTLSAPRP